MSTEHSYPPLNVSISQLQDRPTISKDIKVRIAVTQKVKGKPCTKCIAGMQI